MPQLSINCLYLTRIKEHRLFLSFLYLPQDALVLFFYASLCFLFSYENHFPAKPFRIVPVLCIHFRHVLNYFTLENQFSQMLLIFSDSLVASLSCFCITVKAYIRRLYNYRHTACLMANVVLGTSLKNLVCYDLWKNQLHTF